MTRPLLIDLFCGAGGAAMGYHRAGFDIIGIDNRPQPNYPFTFIHADALNPPLDLTQADAIHASPPCQAYSVANNIHGRTDHPQLIEPTRDLLMTTGRPYVIENVPRAPLRSPYVLCGRALGIGVKRHRWFETNIALLVPECPRGHPGDWLLVFGHTVLTRGQVTGKAKGGGNTITRTHVGVERGREAMGIDWMTRVDLSEAIPPAYTELIGEQLMFHATHPCNPYPGTLHSRADKENQCHTKTFTAKSTTPPTNNGATPPAATESASPHSAKPSPPTSITSSPTTRKS